MLQDTTSPIGAPRESAGFALGRLLAFVGITTLLIAMRLPRLNRVLNASGSTGGNLHEVAHPAAAVTASELLPQPPLDEIAQPEPDRALGVNVRDFGAAGNGIADDTAAIQRAIDSLGVTRGVLNNGTSPIGGVVYLPAGIYRTSSTIRLKSGIILRGQGPTSTIQNVDPEKSDAAITLVAADSQFNWIIAVAVENLSVQTGAACGIRAAGFAPRAVVVQCRFDNLSLSTGNWAIYLPAADAYSQNLFLRNIHVSNMGAGALWIDGNANHIEQFYTEGTARADFAATPAIMRVGGSGNSITGCIIGGLPASAAATAFYVTGGGLTWERNWQTLSTVTDGIAYRFDDVEGAACDQLNGLDATHRAAFHHCEGVNIQQVVIGSATSLPKVVTADSASAVRIQKVDTSDAPGLPPASTPLASVRLAGINARDFGASGSDTLDDTLAIQAALDSAQPGQTILLPRGTYLLSAPLRLRSGITLRGEGSGTDLLNTDPAPNHAAILLAGSLIRDAAICDLTINTASAYGITAPHGVSITHLRFENLVMSTGNWGIYIPNDLSRSTLRNIALRSLGTGAIWVQGNGNLIDGVNTEAGYRADFARNIPALLRVGGDNNTIRDCIIEGGAPATAYYVTGRTVTWRSNWGELGACPSGVGYVFDKVAGMDADQLHHLTPRQHAALRNSAGIVFSVADINGSDSDLSANFRLDAGSSVTLQEVIARRDAGSLDDPRFHIGGIWNMTAGSYIDTRLLGSGDNLVTNGDFADGLSGWAVVWGGATGTTAIDTGPDGRKRLIVTVTSNPQNATISIGTTLRVPGSWVGQPAYLTYTVDHDQNTRIVPYTANASSARACGFMTAQRIDALQSSQTIRFMMTGNSGSAWIKDVRLIAAPTKSGVYGP